MVRVAATVLLLCAVAAAPLACSKESARVGDGKVHVLCSTFPMFLFTRRLADGAANVEVELMLPAAMGCPHEYTLTPQDLQKIARADIFVANGLGMEEYLGAPLKNANPRIVLIDSSAGIDDLLPLSPEAHEADGKAPAGHHPAGPNPHLFACPRMAAKVVRNIAAGLSQADASNAETFKRNGDTYAAELEELSNEMTAATKNLPAHKIVTEHAVFDYLARDCGLEIVAVVEEEPGQEPAAAEMLALVRMIKASGAAALFTEPQYSANVSETIAREAGIPVATLDPVASGPENPPMEYYVKMMRANVGTLVRTLGGGGH